VPIIGTGLGLEGAVSYSGVAAGREGVSGMRGTLSGAGAVSLLVAVALAGGGVDVVTGAGLRIGFAIGLTLGSLLAAMLVRRDGLLLVVFAPPLVFLAASLLFVLVSAGGIDGAGTLVDAATGWLVYGFPAMAAATGAAAVTAGIRAARSG
jgi:hypothetical protein